MNAILIQKLVLVSREDTIAVAKKALEVFLYLSLSRTTIVVDFQLLLLLNLLVAWHINRNKSHAFLNKMAQFGTLAQKKTPLHTLKQGFSTGEIPHKGEFFKCN